MTERTLVEFRDAEGDRWVREDDGTFTLLYGEDDPSYVYSHYDLEEILGKPGWLPLTDKVYGDVETVEKPLSTVSTQDLLEELSRRVVTVDGLRA